MTTCSIVTGCSSGNGLAIAQRLHSSGHVVLGVDRIIPKQNTSYEVLNGNVTNKQTIEKVFHRVSEIQPKQLYLINNAGITKSQFPQSEATWKETLDVNLSAPYFWSMAFFDLVRQGAIEQGGIVFIGSLATSTGFPKNPSYQASKSGVLGLTRAFAVDLGPYGFRANCVSPGYIRTSMTSQSFNDAELNEARTRHMLLRRWGEADDVAHAVNFLCSNQASYITGVNLPVDGGWLACGLVG